MIEKIVMRVLAGLALCTLLYLGYAHYRANMKELTSLRQYKASVEARSKVSTAGQISFAKQEGSAARQKTAQDERRSIIEAKTIEIAHEDKATADFLSMPIPQRLRDADRETREPGGLESGERAPGAAGTAN